MGKRYYYKLSLIKIQVKSTATRTTTTTRTSFISFTKVSYNQDLS